jgi:hypothetical protein
VAHDIHKVDYQATVTVSGGSSVTVSMSDGNERQIANWTKDFFEGLEPRAKTPSLGQTLHLDVVEMTPKRCLGQKSSRRRPNSGCAKDCSHTPMLYLHIARYGRLFRRLG